MPFPAIHPALERALAARNYLEPTPVQEAVLQPEAEERDLIVSAQTGRTARAKPIASVDIMNPRRVTSAA